MSGGRSRRADLKIRLNWEPRSYWMLIEDEPISMDSIRGIDLLDPSMETGKDGVSSLCLQAAAQCRGSPSWVHPLVQILEVNAAKLLNQPGLVSWPVYDVS